jgi:hypothetical protein
MSEASARTPGFVAWPEKLITQAEAFVLAGNWHVHAEHRQRAENGVQAAEIILACDQCGQSCGQLRRGTIVYNGTLDEMLSMVLRHMVMAHDVSLAGLRKAHDDG